MGHLTYNESKKLVTKTIIILGVITLAEVAFALLAKGYLIDDFTLPLWLLGIVMITMSIVKAYLIVYEFMHMKYEVPGLVKTVLLPTLLLVWAIIAFFWEGNDWKNRRNQIKEFNSEEVQNPVKQGIDIRQLTDEDFM